MVVGVFEGTRRDWEAIGWWEVRCNCTVLGMGCFETDAFLVGTRDDDAFGRLELLCSLYSIWLCVSTLHFSDVFHFSVFSEESSSTARSAALSFLWIAECRNPSAVGEIAYVL